MLFVQKEATRILGEGAEAPAAPAGPPSAAPPRATVARCASIWASYVATAVIITVVALSWHVVEGILRVWAEHSTAGICAFLSTSAAIFLLTAFMYSSLAGRAPPPSRAWPVARGARAARAVAPARLVAMASALAAVPPPPAAGAAAAISAAPLASAVAAAPAADVSPAAATAPVAAAAPAAAAASAAALQAATAAARAQAAPVHAVPTAPGAPAAAAAAASVLVPAPTAASGTPTAASGTSSVTHTEAAPASAAECPAGATASGPTEGSRPSAALARASSAGPTAPAGGTAPATTAGLAAPAGPAPAQLPATASAGAAPAPLAGGLEPRQLPLGAGQFRPSQEPLRSRLLEGLVAGTEIREMEGFRGGQNSGVWIVSGPADVDELVLKLVRCTSSHPGLPTEAENCARLLARHPAMARDGQLALPTHVFSCLGPSGEKLHDLLVMRKARGDPLATVIARRWHGGEAQELMRVMTRLGRFLSRLHRRYEGLQHGDFQPSNVLLHEETGEFTLVDVGGMGITTVKTDVEHFEGAMRTLAAAYKAPQLADDTVRHFLEGYAEEAAAQAAGTPLAEPAGPEEEAAAAATAAAGPGARPEAAFDATMRPGGAPPLEDAAALEDGRLGGDAWRQRLQSDVEVIQRIYGAISRRGLSPHELFERLDLDADGVLGWQDVGQLLRSFSPERSEQELRGLFCTIGGDERGAVTLPAFCLAFRAAGEVLAHGLLRRLRAALSRRGESPQGLFFRLDADGDSLLRPEDLEGLIADLEGLIAEFAPGGPTAELARALGADEDGCVALPAFCGALTAVCGPPGSERECALAAGSAPPGAEAEAAAAPRAVPRQRQRRPRGRGSEIARCLEANRRLPGRHAVVSAEDRAGWHPHAPWAGGEAAAARREARRSPAAAQAAPRLARDSEERLRQFVERHGPTGRPPCPGEAGAAAAFRWRPAVPGRAALEPAGRVRERREVARPAATGRRQPGARAGARQAAKDPEALEKLRQFVLRHGASRDRQRQGPGFEHLDAAGGAPAPVQGSGGASPAAGSVYGGSFGPGRRRRSGSSRSSSSSSSGSGSSRKYDSESFASHASGAEEGRIAGSSKGAGAAVAAKAAEESYSDDDFEGSDDAGNSDSYTDSWENSLMYFAGNLTDFDLYKVAAWLPPRPAHWSTRARRGSLAPLARLVLLARRARPLSVARLLLRALPALLAPPPRLSLLTPPGRSARAGLLALPPPRAPQALLTPPGMSALPACDVLLAPLAPSARSKLPTLLLVEEVRNAFDDARSEDGEGGDENAAMEEEEGGVEMNEAVDVVAEVQSAGCAAHPVAHGNLWLLVKEAWANSPWAREHWDRFACDKKKRIQRWMSLPGEMEEAEAPDGNKRAAFLIRALGTDKLGHRIAVGEYDPAAVLPTPWLQTRRVTPPDQRPRPWVPLGLGARRAPPRGAPRARAVPGAAAPVRLAAERRLHNASREPAFNVSNCGPAPKYEHASPRNAADAKETKYVSGEGHVEVTFSAGDQVEYKCSHGFSVDGSLDDGERTFTANCSELGYFKPGGVCLKASKCGKVPNISHAMPTGKTQTDGSVEFVCAHGYSLDGKRAVPGGLGANTLFLLKCVEFSGKYKESSMASASLPRSCLQARPGAGRPASGSLLVGGKIINMYNGVFNALFVVDCKDSATLKNGFGKMQGPPATLDSACGKFQDGALAGQCSGLVATMKSEFSAKEQELKDHLKKVAKENAVFNMSHPDKDRPSIDGEANEFCAALWGLLELPQKDEMPPGASESAPESAPGSGR
ncbi:unnamed protein product [Prorocentrum cordatum]|uniref:Calmodulin n=1 Tax=Prorocentrum cordatum TaxID=2364126 RepID=A0ABN9TW40_9DINO|nr:unnamed protein product [Polarella glacialis]